VQHKSMSTVPLGQLSQLAVPTEVPSGCEPIHSIFTLGSGHRRKLSKVTVAIGTSVQLELEHDGTYTAEEALNRKPQDSRGSVPELLESRRILDGDGK